MRKLSADALNELFEYRDGKLFWKISPSQNTLAGEEAGFLRSSEGYYGVSIKDVTYKRSILIWIMHFGKIAPGLVIDHVDLDKANDKIENLRLATISQNAQNKPKQKRNTSGFKGVTTRKFGFEASIKYKGYSKYLGTFKTAELAYAAYCAEASKLHGEFFKG